MSAVRELVRSWWRELHPALIVTRREIRDSLRDWRIILPILLLVAGFPVLANFVAARGMAFINRYGGDLIMERLFPFLILVVGFFPSTFSLVVALETFVGEKERHSLEPLLATPLTDVQLYVGKLLAAVTLPVLASYLGMGLYVLMLGFSVGWWPSWSLFLLGMALATVEAIVMVSGAVIVSSQSTSVRAANLLASFIIIPMALLLQAEAALLLFANYATLWLIVLALSLVALLLVRLGVRIFNREHLLGRDLDQLNLARGWRIFWQAVWPHQGLRALYLREIPALLRALRPELLVTLLVIGVGGLALGQWAASRFQLSAEMFDFSALTDMESFDTLVQRTGLLTAFSPWMILWHNVRSLLAATLLALLSLGILALLLLLLPMAIIAYIGLQIGVAGINPLLFLLATVVPHGLLELPAAVIATAQAMRMGDVLLAPPEEGGGVAGVVRETGHFIKLFVALVLPLLLVAAWIEVHITPRLLLLLLSQSR